VREYRILKEQPDHLKEIQPSKAIKDVLKQEGKRRRYNNKKFSTQVLSYLFKLLHLPEKSHTMILEEEAKGKAGNVIQETWLYKNAAAWVLLEEEGVTVLRVLLDLLHSMKEDKEGNRSSDDKEDDDDEESGEITKGSPPNLKCDSIKRTLLFMYVLK
jgi:hypothetical protein